MVGSTSAWPGLSIFVALGLMGLSWNTSKKRQTAILLFFETLSQKCSSIATTIWRPDIIDFCNIWNRAKMKSHDKNTQRMRIYPGKLKFILVKISLDSGRLHSKHAKENKFCSSFSPPAIYPDSPVYTSPNMERIQICPVVF